MARPRKWASDAERVAAARAAKKAALVDPALPERSADEPIERPVVTDVRPDEVEQLDISLEAYVEIIKQEAAAYADEVGETDAPYTVFADVVISNRRSDRIKRAEAYARWRYQGVLDGEVASL